MLSVLISMKGRLNIEVVRQEMEILYHISYITLNVICLFHVLYCHELDDSTYL